MSLSELEQVLPVPKHPVQVPSAEDIRSAEEALGLRLPQDYKDYIRTYGSGKIDDFLWILLPGSPNPYGDLITVWKEQKPIFEHMQKGEAPLSYDLHPATPGLLPIGQTDNGDTLFYVCEGPAETWRMAVLVSRDDDVEVFDLGLTSFLAAALRHELDVLPEDLRGEFLPISD